MFSDSVTCADCSKHKYLWILNLMFQLTMVTLMCLVFIIFQIKGTSSPLNIIIAIAYIQNIVMPPLCISSSLKAVDCVLFRCIHAIYPLLFTGVDYFCNDHQGFVICCSPFKKCLSKVCKTKSWDPKRTVLHTFATFFLLSYTKLLFKSFRLSLLLDVHSYTMILGKEFQNQQFCCLILPSGFFILNIFLMLQLYCLFYCCASSHLLYCLYSIHPSLKKYISCLGFQR